MARPETRSRIAVARAQTLPPGTWVEGYFFDDTKLSDGRELTRGDLDEVSRDHPESAPPGSRSPRKFSGAAR